MPLPREIGHRVRHEERLDVALECFARRHQATYMRVDPADDDLVTAAHLHQMGKIAHLEGAVAVLDENDIARRGA